MTHELLFLLIAVIPLCIGVGIVAYRRGYTQCEIDGRSKWFTAGYNAGQIDGIGLGIKRIETIGRN